MAEDLAAQAAKQIVLSFKMGIEGSGCRQNQCLLLHRSLPGCSLRYPTAERAARYPVLCGVGRYDLCHCSDGQGYHWLTAHP